jgi:hypothetical protein
VSSSKQGRCIGVVTTASTLLQQEGKAARHLAPSTAVVWHCCIAQRQLLQAVTQCLRCAGVLQFYSWRSHSSARPSQPTALQPAVCNRVRNRRLQHAQPRQITCCFGKRGPAQRQCWHATCKAKKMQTPVGAHSTLHHFVTATWQTRRCGTQNACRQELHHTPFILCSEKPIAGDGVVDDCDNW